MGSIKELLRGSLENIIRTSHFEKKFMNGAVPRTDLLMGVSFPNL
jgi:hypothetical protein